MRKGTPVDPERDEARRWLEDELSQPDYQVRESVFLRAWRWVTDHLPDLQLPGQLPAWTTWAVLALVLLTALAIVLFAARDRWRTGSLTARAHVGVLGESGVSASDYRRRAAAALEAGDHDTALLDAYRALATGAVERTLVDGRPGRTTHEVAVALAPVFPGEADELVSAADTFDAVLYGDARATAQQAQAVVQLERRVSLARPVLPGTPYAPQGAAT